MYAHKRSRAGVTRLLTLSETRKDAELHVGADDAAQSGKELIRRPPPSTR
jgi:hypothetical protein